VRACPSDQLNTAFNCADDRALSIFRDTGKRMLIEWDSGKLDIGKDAKKRLAKKADVLEEMKLSDVKPKMKKENPYAGMAQALGALIF